MFKQAFIMCKADIQDSRGHSTEVYCKRIVYVLVQPVHEDWDTYEQTSSLASESISQ